MIRRRYVLLAPMMAIALGGCDSDPGPIVPSTVDKPKDAAAVTTPPKTSEGGRALKTDEPAPGGPPTKAVP